MATRSQTYKQDPDYIKLNNFQKAIYKLGDLYLPDKIKDALDIDLIGSHKKTFYISGWSLGHTAIGALVGYIFLLLQPLNPTNYFLAMFAVHTLWEAMQVFIGISYPYRLTGRSNFVDILVDTAMFMIGAGITKALWK
jgi:hypothetical protein